MAPLLIPWGKEFTLRKSAFFCQRVIFYPSCYCNSKFSIFLTPSPFLFWRSFCNFRLNYTLKILFVHISGSSNSMCLKADPSFLPTACTYSSSCIPHLGSNSYIFHGTQTKISAFPSPYQLVTKSCIICLLGISSDCACFPSSLAIKTLTFSCLGNTI